MDLSREEKLSIEQIKLMDELYKRCMDAESFTEWLRNNPNFDTDIDRLNIQLGWMKAHYCNLSPMGLSKLRYDQYLIEFQTEIDKLNKEIHKKFMKSLLDGQYVVFGYRSIKDPLFSIIPKWEWNFLTIDYEKNKANFEDVSYYGLRFLSDQDLKKLPEAESLAFHILSNFSEPIPPPAKEDESSGSPVETLANQAQKTVKPLNSISTYQKRVVNFEQWIEESPGLDIGVLTKHKIFSQWQLFKNSECPKTFATFEKDFWGPYAAEKGIQKTGGRPKKLGD